MEISEYMLRYLHRRIRIVFLGMEREILVIKIN